MHLGSTAGSGKEQSVSVVTVLYCNMFYMLQVLDAYRFPASGFKRFSPIVRFQCVLETAADICKGMVHLHTLNVLHCDLKASVMGKERQRERARRKDH